MSKIKNKGKVNFFDILLLVILLAIVSLMAILLLWAFFTSLKASDMSFMHNKIGLPNDYIWNWKWSNYIESIKKFRAPYTLNDGTQGFANFGMLLFNTLSYAGVNGFLHAIIPCTVAYLCVKFPCKFSKLLSSLVIITMMLPIVGSYPSMLRILNLLNLYNTRLGNWLQNANFLGMYFLVFYAIFKGVNKELWEAAEIDGANQWKIYFRLIIPITINTIALVFMLQFITFWNEYQVALLYLPGYPTLSVAIYLLSLDQQEFFSWLPGRLSSYMVFLLPILVLFLVFKDKLMGNIAIGGVKE